MMISCSSKEKQPTNPLPYLKKKHYNRQTTPTKLQKDQNKFNRKYKNAIENDTILYTTNIIHDSNYQAKELLEKAKFSQTPYPSILKAFDIHTQMQNGIFAILDTQQQQGYIKEHKKYIHALFGATLTPDNIQETFNRWINYKRTLFDRENRLLSNNRMRAKKSILNRKRRELARANQTDQIKELKIDIANFERSLSYDLAHAPNPPQISYQDISTLLKRDQLYIDFAKVADFYYIFLLDKGNNITFKKVENQAIDSTIQAIRGEIEKINDPQKYPHSFPDIALAKKQYGKLYDLIIKKLPISKQKSLIISPDGLLDIIPFEAFYHQKYLIEKMAIGYIPSGREWVKLHRNEKHTNEEIVVFANPNFDQIPKGSEKKRGGVERELSPTFQQLEGSKREAKKIKALFPSAQLFLEERATERNLLEIHTPKILHLSTHGFFLKNSAILNPMLKSGIALSGANASIRKQQSNGIISALELSGINLEGTELVVLSACKTGLGEIEEAQGVIGLNRAFMQAGAKEIVMSLWSVSDRATASLMERFYENIKHEKRYGEALREAKIWMISEKNSHPYYWAGFVGSGVNQ